MRNFWNFLKPGFYEGIRVVFIGALDKAIDYRNRLMHFRDPLTKVEMTRLTEFCDLVREIQLTGPTG